MPLRSALVAAADLLAAAGAHVAVVADLDEVVARAADHDRPILGVHVDDVVAGTAVDLVEAVAGEADDVGARAAADVVGGGLAAALQVVVAVAAVDVRLAAARRAVDDVVAGARRDAVDAVAAPVGLAVGPDDVVAAVAEQPVGAEGAE